MICVPLIVSFKHFHILSFRIIFKSRYVQPCRSSHTLVYTLINYWLILGCAKLWFKNLWLLCFIFEFVNVASNYFLLRIWINFIFLYLIIWLDTIYFVDLCPCFWNLHQIIEIFNDNLLLCLLDKLLQYLDFNIIDLHLVLDIIFSLFHTILFNQIFKNIKILLQINFLIF